MMILDACSEQLQIRACAEIASPVSQTRESSAGVGLESKAISILAPAAASITRHAKCQFVVGTIDGRGALQAGYQHILHSTRSVLAPIMVYWTLLHMQAR